MIPPYNDTNIPFRLDIYEGLGQVNGRLRIEDDAVLLEYMMKDAVFGVLRSDVRELQLRFIDILEVTFHNGWFRKRLRFRSARIGSFADIPGAEDGTLTLSIARKDVEHVVEAVAHIRLRTAEEKLKALEGTSASTTSLPS